MAHLSGYGLNPPQNKFRPGTKRFDSLGFGSALYHFVSSEGLAFGIAQLERFTDLQAAKLPPLLKYRSDGLKLKLLLAVPVSKTKLFRNGRFGRAYPQVCPCRIQSVYNRWQD